MTDQPMIMHFRRSSIATAASAILFFVNAAAAAPITNEDVIQLSKSGLDDNVIVEAIARSETKFDTSIAGIIRLKEAGISNAVIAKILTSASPPPVAAATMQPARDPLCSAAAAGSIIIRSTEGEKAIGFKKGRKESESSGAGRAIASVFSFGIVKMSKTTHFALLPGTKAETRSLQQNQEFIGLAIERGQSPNDAIKLVSFDEGGSKGNYGRILPIGEGSVSYWGSVQGTLSHAPLEKYTSPLEFDKMQDECTINGRSVAIWKAKTVSKLSPGEYAIFLEPDRYHDFAVDEAPASPIKK